MSARRRNFWILVTIMALSLALFKWINGNQGHSNHCKFAVKVEENTDATVKVERIIIRNGERLEAKRKQCKMSAPKTSCSSAYTHHRSFYTPSINEPLNVDKTPKVRNYALVSQEIENALLKNKLRVDGEVEIKILVDQDGNYMAHRINTKEGKRVLQVYEDHVDQFKFSPAIKNNRTVRCWVTVPTHVNP